MTDDADGVDNGLEARLRSALKAALRARDTVAVATLRTALGAIDNAGAVTAAPAPSTAGDEHVAGSLSGLGAAEVPRRLLDEAELHRIVTRELEERRSAADEYAAHGHDDRAARLRAEADVLGRVLTEPPPGA